MMIIVDVLCRIYFLYIIGGICWFVNLYKLLMCVYSTSITNNCLALGYKMKSLETRLHHAEEAVIHLAQAIGLPEEEIVKILSDGIGMYFGGAEPENIHITIIDELRATFDAY